jgi:hypothetical protein
MRIRRRAFPNRFAILPSDAYRFGAAVADGQPFTVVVRHALANGIDVVVVNAGLLAFDFAGHAELGDLFILEGGESGEVPQEVIENRDRMIAVQGARMRWATFVSACVLGVHAHETHSSVQGALFAGLDEIYVWVELPEGRFGVPSQETVKLAQRLQRRTKGRHIPEDHVVAGLELADRLIGATGEFHAADPVSMIVMTYQAMILHHRQHAGASVALLALVAEAAVEELVLAHGFVAGTAGRLPLLSGPTPISKSAATGLGQNGRIKLLAEYGVLKPFLVDRLNGLRKARNALMHDAQDATPNQSGDGLTVVRDLLRLCTREEGFELNMSWAYRL